MTVKQCTRGHHWYTGRKCPVCEYLFGDEMYAIGTRGDIPDVGGRGTMDISIPELDLSDDTSLDGDDCRYIN